MPRVLVTGGAGFLGSHLCERLLADGADVLCVDNFYSGVKDNIAHLLSNPHFELIRHDVTFPLYVEVDEIYNLAAQSHVAVSFEEPEYTANADGIGALRLRLVAVKQGATPFALRGTDGRYLPEVLLDLDYWALMPR